MAYHRSRSLGVGAKIIRRRKSLTSICHCSKDRSISLTLIIYPPNTQLLHSLAQFLHKFIPFFCVFHLGFGLGYKVDLERGHIAKPAKPVKIHRGLMPTMLDVSDLESADHAVTGLLEKAPPILPA